MDGIRSKIENTKAIKKFKPLKILKQFFLGSNSMYHKISKRRFKTNEGIDKIKRQKIRETLGTKIHKAKSII